MPFQEGLADGEYKKILNVSFDGERTMVDQERWHKLKSSVCK